jgi:transaldolase
MKIFLDTADVAQIREALRWGVVDGVTTNPTHVAKTGADPRKLYPEICALVPGPVSLETVSLEADGIVAEGRELAKIGKNVVVKVPVTREGLIAVGRLAGEGIRSNVTVTFSPLQALLAAKAGASYISPFVGRLDNVGHDGMEVAEQIRQIYDNYGYHTEIIVAAVRHPLHVLRAALAGADICTMSFEVLGMLYDHPLTEAGIAQFLQDWQKVPK